MHDGANDEAGSRNGRENANAYARPIERTPSYMKKCPYCAEEIQDEAIKCKHCGEFIGAHLQDKQDKWYFKTHVLIVAFLCFGPLALPLVWFNPRYSLKSKTVITAVILLLTYLLTILLVKSIANIYQYYKFIFDQLQQ